MVNGYEAKVRLQLQVLELGHAEPRVPNPLSPALWAQRQYNMEEKHETKNHSRRGAFSGILYCVGCSKKESHPRM